jgi:hypothetical protein
VKHAELASKHVEGPREFSDLALAASRHWTFVPARTGERSVASTILLHYRFGNPAQPAARLP